MMEAKMPKTHSLAAITKRQAKKGVQKHIQACAKIPNVQIQEIAKRLKKIEVLKRQQRESIDIPVGVHTVCGGAIYYRSQFVSACSPSQILYGGNNPVQEATKCRCISCGTLFDTEHLAYRNKVLEHRNREVK
jgi:hypothetical protein